MSHPPPSISRHRVTCLSLKNASAPWGQTVARWPLITISRVSYIQYLLACQKSQRSNSYNMVKSGLTWRRVFRRRHLGRRVTAVTCLRWSTVIKANESCDLVWLFSTQSNITKYQLADHDFGLLTIHWGLYWSDWRKEGIPATNDMWILLVLLHKHEKCCSAKSFYKIFNHMYSAHW